MSARSYPWPALIEALGEARFAEIRRALGAAGADPLDRDRFLLEGAVGQVLRDLVPGDAPADALTWYAALLQMLYLHWDAGAPVHVVDRDTVAARLAAPPERAAATPPARATYLQLPERLVWAAPLAGGPHEPLDGAFVVGTGGRIRALGVLGFRPERLGFSTIEAEAPVPMPRPVRPDGTATFATVLPAGERMGYFSLTSEAELAFLSLLALPEGPG